MVIFVLVGTHTASEDRRRCRDDCDPQLVAALAGAATGLESAQSQILSTVTAAGGRAHALLQDPPKSRHLTRRASGGGLRKSLCGRHRKIGGLAERTIIKFRPIAVRFYSALMLAARITSPHFLVSSIISFPNSAGDIGMGSPPSSARRVCIF